MATITVGQTVDIKRSDGRVHGAVVTNINYETRSVTVEWFERGETKGKEVEVDQILALNAGLRSPITAQMPPPAQATQQTVKTEKKTEQRDRRTIGPNNLPGTSKAPTPAAGAATSVVVNPPKPALPSGFHQSVSAAAVANGYSNGHHSNENENPSLMRNAKSREDLNIPDAVKHKSATVKEIEKLKKNREERRARQEEMRQQKQELQEQLEPGNPNWEFLQMIIEFRETLDIRPLQLTDAIEDHQICVCVRKRPMNKRELSKKDIDVLSIPNRDHVIVHEPKSKVDLTKYLENQTFRFDYTFDEEASNEMVYRFTAQPLVKTIFENGFATCFAYGQTGSGKTHTMGGDFNGKAQDVSRGIYAFAARDVFKILNKNYKRENFVVSCSFFEIYSGKVFDLLGNKNKLRVLEDGKAQVQVVGLTETVVDNDQEVLRLITKGSELRTAGQTSANAQSSRSHAVFQIILRKRGAPKAKIHGKFSLIDLAGNERGADTSSSNRQTRMEGAEINKSLLALKECIRALGRKNAQHLPFRASKLTLVLRDSFVGENSRTCMIAMVSPGLASCEHTLNTLRYADRVKELGANPEAGAKGVSAEDEAYAAMDNKNDSDLALLHSHNVAELDDELYQYQVGVSHLQEYEDQVVEEHAKLVEEEKVWVKRDDHLVRQAAIVDYDVDKYADDLESFLSEKIDRLTRLRSDVREWRKMLATEEQVARTIYTSSSAGGAAPNRRK